MIPKPWTLLHLYRRAAAAYRYGRDHNLTGIEFADFGRRIGHRLLFKGRRQAVSYLLNPVSLIRYFEFPFALSCLPRTLDRCLDVSSPRLFSLFVARARSQAHILMINPDASDVSGTRRSIDALKVRNVQVEPWDISQLIRDGGKSAEPTFDCIWCISVIEHVHGAYDDREAMRMMWKVLKPKGRLIVTTMVDRTFWEEYRGNDEYGTQSQTTEGKYFFQRWYDKAAVWDRLVDPLGIEPIAVRWHGETVPGQFNNYIHRWLTQGLACIVEDPREVADNWQEYPSWEAMPAMGICSFCMEKP